MKVEMQEKWEKVKTHFKDNKEKYLIGASCLIAGVAVGFTIKKRPQIFNIYNKEVIDVDAEKMIGNSIYLQKTITKYGNDVGRPGIPVIDLETFKEFQSITLAAKDAGVSVNGLRKHLQGAYPDVNGRKFGYKDELAYLSFLASQAAADEANAALAQEWEDWLKD